MINVCVSIRTVYESLAKPWHIVNVLNRMVVGNQPMILLNGKVESWAGFEVYIWIGTDPWNLGRRRGRETTE